MSADRAKQQGPSTRARIFATAAILIALAVAAGGSAAAFTATTSNANNSIQAGSVSIGDNDSPGAAMLSLSNARPGATDSGCIKVTYSGSLASTVRLYATTTGTGLAQYVDLKVTRGTTTDAFDTCTNFVPDSTNYISQGAGVIYSGTLQSFPANYTSGLVDPLSATPESWTTSEVHAYKFEVTLQSSAPNAAQGLTANSSFSWEARNQ